MMTKRRRLKHFTILHSCSMTGSLVRRNGEEEGRRVREWRGGREESEGMERREGGE